MEHYYSSEPTSESVEREISYKFDEEVFKFTSDNGVFSKNHVDLATDFLLKTISKEPINGQILDMGCGYGVIGIVLTKRFHTQTWMADVNQRALRLAESNLLRNQVKANVILSDGFTKVQEQFDIIVTNPPIRAGKTNLYAIYQGAKEHLKQDGCFYLVINKKHGAPSTINYLKELFGNCEVLDKKAGFHVLKCKKI